MLEDAAQAIGAAYQGRRAGRLGQAAAFSFYPSKNLGGFGDGGLMTTDDPALGRKLARLRVHGMEPKYHHHEVGINSRLDALQAAVLRVKLRHLDAWTAGRGPSPPATSPLPGPWARRPASRSRSSGRAAITSTISTSSASRPRSATRCATTSPARQVGTEIYYPIPLHLQPCFAALGHQPGDFPVAESAARETLALPMYPELTDEQQRYVVGSIRQFLDGHGHAHLASEKAA